jgi:hypothetical protein
MAKNERFDIVRIREKVLSYYKDDYVFTLMDIELLKGLKTDLNRAIIQNREVVEDREETIINQCQNIYQRFKDRIFSEG